jgi:thiol:disulfide interchange protein
MSARTALLAGTGLLWATAAVTQQPIPHAHIFPDVSAAQGDIDAALKTAKREHKRVLLDFGGDWCGDCQVLNLYFHQPENQSLLDKNYVLVDVNVGRIDQNLDVGTKYGVDLKKGVPALAVVRPDGKSLYGQSGQFSDMRHMRSASVHHFLEKWKK